MRQFPPSRYEQWRAQSPALLALREGGRGSLPPERLMQAIWYHQRLLRDGLTLTDGTPLRVLHPGFWNHEAGPDFHGAVIRIGDGDTRSGQIEIDVEGAGWRQHGHDRNPAFAGVILHVVWDDGGAEAGLPTLRLKPFLDSPVEALTSALAGEAGLELPEGLTGQCCAPLAELGQDVVAELLEQAALCRFQAKAAHFEARARQSGWEQSLWEGLFRGLGYKHNAWPMQRLGELLPVLRGGEQPSAADWQARLLGVSGLLPEELEARFRDTENYFRGIWDRWWRERDRFREWVFPREMWRFGGIRPANHPQRRLALASHWLAEGKVIGRLESWIATEVKPAHLGASLLEALQVGEDEFWSRHWTLASAPMEAPQPLLGPQRVTDLAVNVILPWFWVRARSGGNVDLVGKIERRNHDWPRGEDNAILKLARQRLLSGARPKALKTAAAQQGLLQVVRDFCGHSNSLCEQCPFPALARSLASG